MTKTRDRMVKDIRDHMERLLDFKKQCEEGKQCWNNTPDELAEIYRDMYREQIAPKLIDLKYYDVSRALEGK